MPSSLRKSAKSINIYKVLDSGSQSLGLDQRVSSSGSEGRFVPGQSNRGNVFSWRQSLCILVSSSLKRLGLGVSCSGN